MAPRRTAVTLEGEAKPDPAGGERSQVDSSNMQWLEDILRKIDFFSFDPRQPENLQADIAMVVRTMEKQDVIPGEPVILEGQNGISLYLIRRGQVGVWVTRDGKRFKLATLLPGDYFGEMSLLTGGPCSATVIAETHGHLYLLKPKVFKEVVKSNGAFSKRVACLAEKRRKERNEAVECLEHALAHRARSPSGPPPPEKGKGAPGTSPDKKSGLAARQYHLWRRASPV